MRVGQILGGLPGQPVIALMPLGPRLLLSFLPPASMLNLSVCFISWARANGSSGGSHLYFCCFNDFCSCKRENSHTDS